jgi:HD-GYP domain-containing protein (c-di-GMP phosphodiesterase class II)
MVASMSPGSDQASLGSGMPLAFDASADATVGEHRSSLRRGLAARDRLAVFLLGGGFLAASAALAAALPARQPAELAVLALYIGVYALVSRIEFEVYTGASAPTQLVLVPMLFVLPLQTVPFAVAAGLILASLVGWSKREIGLERTALNLIGSWHALGPVLVLWLAGEPTLGWSHWPVYLAALSAQFAFEALSVIGYEWIARGTQPRDLLPHLGRAQLVDATLAPVGLAFAFAAQDASYAVLLVLPLAGLLRVFARERRARIDNALELSAAYRGTAFLLGDVVEADDHYTGLHSRHVVDLATAVADELGLSASERHNVEFTALLHDVGKIRIPGEIVNKPGKLTPDERQLMETHTVEGERMLVQVGGLLGTIGRMVRSCHERWDGGGYPDGLAGEAIPLVSRIVMCCDAFSAMTTDRPYRKALSEETAVNELRAQAGAQFDPQVVGALIAVVGLEATTGSR